MKVIGIGENNTRIVELSFAELEALQPPEPFQRFRDGAPIGSEIDILKRLALTLGFEKDKQFVPHAVAGIRKAADELERAFGLGEALK